ncbi:MAG: hypothetical protein KIS78_07125 [Labilithrix sp.]|nr:hypothetical protein [Labilithrix sp.]MCW5832204.1 hypothetical protein [Labilithrix sp.]
MRRAGVVILLAVGTFVAFVAACSNQGEGERCEVLNGDDDCKTDEGLVCYPMDQLRNASSDRCCPADRSKATHPVCVTPTTVIGDATTPADTGPAPSEDASTGDASDASSDASSDADADANQ